ncbi:MAG: bis(5'-nucleosyl)-tetraphosphatase (symmetrical) YqeK [Solobacterium sp.]|nr:bis(5'-nucleosyl)-tetraphosphatase (symmetrical) YqeK [Solobacterium sp.]
MTVLVCPFDPVTQKEKEAVLAYRKDHRETEICVVPAAEGTLSFETRLRLLKKAFAPYRHVHVLSAAEDAVQLEEADEEAVRSGMFRLAASGIRRILIEEGFFLQETAKAMCRERRYVHSAGVAATCRRLAQAHHMDQAEALKAGWLHDVTKAMPDEEAEKIIAVWKPEWLSISPKVWHSYTAVVWLKQNMGLHDRRILNAIEHHTLGDGNSSLDRILYIADKIEPGRGYDTSREWDLAAKDLKKGAGLVREESRSYIYEKEGIHV